MGVFLLGFDFFSIKKGFIFMNPFLLKPQFIEILVFLLSFL
ncbi:hypothetical protein FEM21_25030 [Flavobacterium seoulense]|uniref:Uncharacterized protein n=1 Tax=Flavobacterium seoulense TaxID=1492738 RepID=A0A066WUS0_9FLAO|nr:hypothetical protein FEM21_25030 [Flavobacterium seoulense]